MFIKQTKYNINEFYNIQSYFVNCIFDTAKINIIHNSEKFKIIKFLDKDYKFFLLFLALKGFLTECKLFLFSCN